VFFAFWEVVLVGVKEGSDAGGKSAGAFIELHVLLDHIRCEW
jgi:hypothetical protein